MHIISVTLTKGIERRSKCLKTTKINQIRQLKKSLNNRNSN
uniref:Uncharacterized protein n=1 Tax=Rhizophora mucronata TaxID=61149 RepID=A0A2P2Q0E1_RHIMU